MMQKRFSDLSAEAVSSTPQALAEAMQTEFKRWTKVVQIAGIQPQ
jgi:tripartite-type tricarboxylate transporter receptor subunit TctC